ncbi:hypothetical protein [Rhizobium sp. Root483D2]|uniref:hypothetical protein n=1 Tax=Rhizobium sp. Root483D2 TaxID=1736545 RepID=UPI0007155873|nr:hypothetical protein [Rhizobium sp. Root483D2]KQY25948.1 hypothetical protein ASD32_26055 [Rhizobium sp. Root483D2]
MNRYDEVRTDLIDILQGLGAEATSLYAVGVPMVEQGFNQDEILNALMALDREKVIELLPGNRLRVLPGQKLESKR